MKFKTGDMVHITKVGIDKLKCYEDMCGEIISWIKKKGEVKYKVRIYFVESWETAYFKEDELELIENMGDIMSNIL